jgi:peptidoglycan hydrolase CwlO-like protein
MELLRKRVSKVAAVVALACAAAIVPATAHAQTTGDLADAQRRVNDLEARITREQGSVRSLQAQLGDLAATVGREQGDLDEVRGKLASTNMRIAAVKARLSDLREQMRTRVRDLYKRGPLPFIDVFLDARSISEFVERAGYASRIAKRDSEVFLQMRLTASKLRGIQAVQSRLTREQGQKVAALRSRQDALSDVFARQQAVLADLAHLRAEAIQLLVTLAKRLGAGLNGLRRVAGQGMTISYGEWAHAFLGSLGAPATRRNLVVVVAWEASEGTMATWNPLATTHAEPGSTFYNGSGVRNYISKDQGIHASIATLQRPGHGYEPITSNLRAGSESMRTGRAINASDWCRGCAGGSYVVGFIPAVERYYDRYAG